jgi:hypothetical protein
MAVFLGTAVQAQCTIDLSSVPGNAVVESFETYPLGASPPGPCYDTLWVPPNSQDTNGWYVRPHAADLTGVGPTVGSQALRVGYHDRDRTPDTIAILQRADASARAPATLPICVSLVLAGQSRRVARFPSHPQPLPQLVSD